MTIVEPRFDLGAAGVAADVHDLADTAERVLDLPIESGQQHAARPVKQILSMIWDQTMLAMTDVSALTPERIAALTGLLGRVRELETAIDDARVADGVEMIRRIRRALAHINTSTTVDELFARSVEEACTLGFDRVLVSTVDDGAWRPQRMFIERDPDLANELVAIGQTAPPQLDGSLIETDIVANGRPGLVYDVQENPRVAKQFVSLSSCTSYGVAPICASDRVVGMVHADSFYTNHRVDATDRAVLNLYAEGLSQSLSRITVLDGLSALRSGLDRLAGGSPISVPSSIAGSSIVAAPQSFSGASPMAATVSSTTAPSPSILSERETDVIELLASGDSNRVIAKKLSISEGTVKTHITHILRKLDASNRAEAVAYWLRRTM